MTCFASYALVNLNLKLTNEMCIYGGLGSGIKKLFMDTMATMPLQQCFLQSLWLPSENESHNFISDDHISRVI